jgi:DNA (cytosine-5)-methyltransferase 1
MLLLENVSGLLSHDNGQTFRIIIESLGELGYCVQWGLLDSIDYVPQNRKRIFIVGFLGKECRREIFPISKYTEFGGLSSKIARIGNFSPDGRYHQSHVIYDVTGVAPTLHAGMGKGSVSVPHIWDNNRLRRLTPKECWRLQGFCGIPPLFERDWVYQLAKSCNSDTQLYKQIGNSVTVPVVQAIAERLVA